MSLVAAASRTVVALFWIATSVCAFLISVPFVFEQFLEPGVVPALAWFARWHGWLALLMVAPTVAAVWPDIASRRAAVAGSLLVWVSAMAGVAAAVGSPLAQLRPGGLAVVASMAALVPLVWLAAIDFALAPWPDTPRATDMTGRDGLAAAGSALAVLLLQTPIAAATLGAVSGLGLAQSAAAHFVLFGAVFTGVTVVRAVADLTSKPAQWEAVAAAVWLATLAGGAAALVLLPALSVSTGSGRAAVFVFGAAIATVLAARGLRLGRAR